MELRAITRSLSEMRGGCRAVDLLVMDVRKIEVWIKKRFLEGRQKKSSALELFVSRLDLCTFRIRVERITNLCRG